MNRFGDVDCSFKRLPPVYGFRVEKVVSLEKALEPIETQIDQLSYFIKVAKKSCCYPNKHGLSKDQSASIYIYTMEWGETTLYRVLNKALRSEDREALKIWFPYLKLFDTALDLLPTVKEAVWRGVPLDVGKNFTENQIFTWWAVSSCSSSVKVIEIFLENKNNSTLFLIEVVNGKKVSGYTQYECENEIILRIGTEFRVKADPLKRADGSHTVHLIEIDEDEDDNDDGDQPLATTMKSLHVNPKPSNKQTLSNKMGVADDIQQLKGIWKLVDGKHFDRYMKELGVGFALRRSAKLLSPTIYISENGGIWSFRSESTFKSTSYEFMPGVEFNETRLDGGHVKSIIIFENDKWIHTRHDIKNGKESTIVRWVDAQGQQQIEMQCGNVKARRWYKRAN